MRFSARSSVSSCRPFDQSRAPREPGTHSGHQYEIARAEPAVGLRVRQRERDRARRGVAIAVDVDHGLLLRNAQLLTCMLDDAHIRLMRNVDVDVLDTAPALGQHGLGGADEYPGRELEHLAAVHLDEVLTLRDRLRGGGGARAAGRQVELRAARAVGAELEAEEAAVGYALEHDRARAVAEQHGGRAVAPVEDARE